MIVTDEVKDSGTTASKVDELFGRVYVEQTPELELALAIDREGALELVLGRLFFVLL